MKKSSFVALLLGTASFVFFALGMCMALLPEWNAFTPGVVSGCLGLLLAIVTWLVWRKLEQKDSIHFSPKAIGTAGVGIVGVLLFGVGMCICMVWEKMVMGIAVGLVGIVLLLCLIPLTKGLHE